MNKNFTSKEDAVVLEEKIKHELDNINELIATCNRKDTELLQDLGWVKLFSHNLKEDISKKADNYDLE